MLPQSLLKPSPNLPSDQANLELDPPDGTANDRAFGPELAHVRSTAPSARANAEIEDALTVGSHRHLCDFLQRVGNVLSPAHSQALQDTLAAFTHLAFERGG